MEKAYFDEKWLVKESYPEFASWLVKGKALALVLISNRFTYQTVESIRLACCVF